MKRQNTPFAVKFEKTYIKNCLVIGVCSLAVFSFILWAVLNNLTVGVDTAIQQAIISIRTPLLTAFFSKFTSLMNWEMVAAYCILLLLFAKTRKSWGFRATFYIIIATVIQQTLKRLIQRPRPDSALRLIEENGFSFPSGHSITVMVFLGYFLGIFLLSLWISKKNLCISFSKLWINVLPLWKKLLIIFLFVGIIGIGFSRLYVCVHYFSDVLGAFSLGIALLCVYFSIDLAFPTENSPLVITINSLERDYLYENSPEKAGPREKTRGKKNQPESMMDQAGRWKTMKFILPKKTNEEKTKDDDKNK